MDHKISIITAGWNGKDFVCRMLESILTQTYRNIQYIYVDDGSTDGTGEIVAGYDRQFADASIEFLYVRQENGGVSAAINTGLRYATGEFLCFLEYDDFLTPDSVEKRLRLLLAHPEWAVVTSDGLAVNESDVTKPLGFLSNKNPNRFDNNHFTALLQGERHTVIYAACHMIRMEAFDATHPGRVIYPSRKGPNIQILLPLYYRYKRGFIDEPLMFYVIRKRSISHSYASTATAYYETIEEIERIYMNTLDSIEMPEWEKEKYRHFIRLKYAHFYLNIAPAVKDLPTGQAAYRLLAENGALNMVDRINYVRMHLPLIEPLYQQLRKWSKAFRRSSNRSY